MNLLRFILMLSFLASILFSQKQATINLNQQIGVQVAYNSRSFGNLKTESSNGALGYEYLTPAGTQLAFYIGANNFIIPSSQPNISDFVSKYSIFYKAGLYQKLWIFYLQGEFLYCKASGKSTYTGNELVKYTFNNKYSFYEYPIKAGFFLNVKRITLSLGLTKSYLYGINEKDLLYGEDDYEVRLGELSYSFTAELPIAYEISTRFDLSPKLNLRLNYTLFEKSDFAITISLWSS